MTARSATITVESDYKLVKAITGQLSVAITSLTVTDPDYEPWLVSTQLGVDGEDRDFSIAHAVTTGPRLSGAMLMSTIIADDGGDNTLEFVVISFDKKGRSEPWQGVVMVKEQAWFNNQAAVLHELTDYLFSI